LGPLERVNLRQWMNEWMNQSINQSIQWLRLALSMELNILDDLSVTYHRQNPLDPYNDSVNEELY
jgi:hypothetical protein